MSLLLDTSIVLWWLAQAPRLSQELYDRLQTGAEPVYVSAASVWEIEIKRVLGKLECPQDLEEQFANSQFLMLDMTARHAILAGRLPPHHNDPFDRMMIAQAQLERLTIVTSDARFQAYGVDLLMT